MEFTITMLNLIWLFISVNAFLIGAVASLAFSFVIALKGEKWLDNLTEKHPWILEERDMSIFAIVRDIRNRKKAKA